MVNQHLKDLDKHHTTIIRILEGVGALGALVIGKSPAAAGEIITGGETVNTAWDEVDDVVGQVNDTANHAQSVYGAGSRQMQRIKQKVGLINSTVERHNSQYTNMPNKSKKLDTGVAEMPRSHSMPVLETRTGGAAGSKAANRAATQHFSIRNPKTPVNASALTTNLGYFDSHLVEGPTEKTLTKLSVRIGKQLYPDLITPFLKNLNGSGVIKMEFAGRCISKKNERHTHMQLFRHRLSINTNYTGAGWPAGTPGTADYILGPQNTVQFNIAGGGTAGGYPAGRTSFRDIINGTTYWAPYNKADLEDLSWNLNALKLNNQLWNATPPAFLATQADKILFQPNDHARQSLIAANNSQAVALPPSGTTRVGAYKYNAVFNKGSVHYDFMNKGLGGAKVEIIIYRLKKNHKLSSAGNTYGGSATVLNATIATAIGQGYLETCVGPHGGTDTLLGRPPTIDDVSQNPAFPFLPVLKKTVGSSMPFHEISRQTFGLPSGSRRELDIILPGEVYDPLNFGALNNVNDYPGIVDLGTYGIMISVSGVKCTQEVVNTAGTPAGTYNIGDMFAAANVQYYGTYTEHMGACQYKDDASTNMYTAGGILMPVPPTGFTNKAIMMLSPESAVRVGAPAAAGTAGAGASHTMALNFDAEAL